MATIQGVYLALFGRPADPAGLAYFNDVTNNGANLEAIANLSGQAEYQDRFTGQTSAEIVNAIYVALFGRAAEDEGAAFWAEELASGRVSPNNIAIAILDSAQGDDRVVVDNKLIASTLFTSSVDTDAERADYRGTFAAEVGRDYLDGITTDPSTIPDQEITDLQIAFLDRDASEVNTVGSSSSDDSV